jgi:hypothetical protein
VPGRAEIDVPAWSALTRSTLKAELYRDETYFREGLRSLGDVLGADTAAQLHRLALVMVKPDGLAAGKTRPVHDFLRKHGFEVLAVDRPALAGRGWRELWRYQLTSATSDRLAVNETLMSRPALLLLVRHPGGELPASVRLAALKGPADMAGQPADCLRRLLGQLNRILSFVHVADEPADVVRELGLLLDRARRERALAAVRAGTLPAADRTLLAEALDRADRGPRDLDPHGALDRAAAVVRAAPADGTDPAAVARLGADVERMRRGERIEWIPFAAALDRAGVVLDEWDVTALGTHFIVYDAPGETKRIDSVPAAAWRATAGPPGRPRCD